MSENKQELLDLSNPEFIGDLTPEQIAAAGQKRKYKDGAYYYGKIVEGVKFNYSQAKLKNGEINAEATGSIWLEFAVAPLKKDGTVGTKLPQAKYQKQFLYDRLNENAMKRAGYTEAQIANVKGQALPDVYEGLRQFLQALFPERFIADFPRWNGDANSFMVAGNPITREQYNAIAAGEKDKVLALQRELRSNPQMVVGKTAFWIWFYDDKDSRTPGVKSDFPSVKFPTAQPPRDWKKGVDIQVQDPDVDFA